MEKYFFDIPVFRCSLKKWEEERIKEVIKLAEQMNPSEEVTDKDFKQAENFLASSFTSYMYSELVGMIRLYTMSSQIRAETFFIMNKRFVRNQKNKKWSYMGKLLELMVSSDITNQEIYELIITELKRECNKSYLKNRHAELKCFETVGPHINYRALTNMG